ncbi:MAG TPA: pyroglutamyl-peptidase I [Pseudolabrys sp.]
MPTILITGFGPFPGSPYNPTGPLVQRLARLRRPRLAGVKIIAHVFPTSYAAVDRELPRLIAKHKPDVLLMFGLAPRARCLRIETWARNSVALLPDASGVALVRHTIQPNGPAALAMPAPAQRLLSAVRSTRVPATLSRDAGRYLCNYLCWRAAEAADTGNGPRLAAFVHVPKIARFALRPGKRRVLALNDLTRAGGALLATVAGLV